MPSYLIPTSFPVEVSDDASFLSGSLSFFRRAGVVTLKSVNNTEQKELYV